MRVLVAGCGAVGGYLAAHLVRLGEDVTALDPWAENRAAIAAQGLRIEEPSGSFSARLPIFATARDLRGQGFDLAILACKLPEAMTLLEALEANADYGGPYLATLNGLVDARIAERVGTDRVMGCIVFGFFGHLAGPGLVQRHRARNPGGEPAVFRTGEVKGPSTERVHRLAALLGRIDAVEVVEDLPRARWTKLVFNAMTSPLAAVSGGHTRPLFLETALRGELTKLALEGVRIAAAAGVSLDAICGISGESWLRAAAGDPAALMEVQSGLIRYGEGLSPGATSGMAQDLARGRPTELDFLNGALVTEASRRGLDAPAHRAVMARLHALEAAQRAATPG
ncbi:MAG TPA: 2-dehydropantoate 2-reductase [Acetobacteraceae bacterium]|nr:2-dehydropantoate 2-reductase [Acetobacteraceae bacterium]